MMKRFLSIICAMFILCTQVSAKGSYIPDDVVGSEYEAAYEVLAGLSILDYNEDGSFRPFTSMTRGDFAIALANIMDVIALDGATYFADVTAEHKAYVAVAKLTAGGVINGVGNGLFRPDESIKGVDAVRMLVSSMGYSVMAEDMGGYPEGYMQTARKIGLLNGVKFENNGEILRGEAAEMLLNSLELPVMSSGNFYESGNVEYTVDKDSEFLYAAMGIEKIKGIVNANDLYSVDGGAIAPEGSLRIDDTVYDCADGEWNDFVGHNVICYYRVDDNSTKKSIVYLQKNPNKTNEKVIFAKDAEGFTFPNFYYGEEGSVDMKKLIVSDDLCMIYNGLPKANIEAEDFCPVNGSLEFIDNNDDRKYDIVNIRTYTNALVSAVTEDAIYISLPVNGKIKVEDYEIFNIFNAQGNKVSVSELKENDVISLYESVDKSVVEIVFSREVVSGTVSASRDDDGVKTLVVDDVSYNVAFDYDASFPSMVSVGAEGTFCLDANGDIYTMIGEKITSTRYGFVVRTWEDTVFERTFYVRLLEENGKLAVRPFASKVKVEGEGSVESLRAYQAATNAISTPVAYKINRAGEITVIDTVATGAGNDDDRLTRGKTGLSGLYRKATMCFNVVLPIDENTKIFVVPNDPSTAEDNDYGFADYKILENELEYNNIDSYSMSDDKLTADILIMNENTSLNTAFGIVTDIGKSMNADGDVCTNYTLQTSTGVTTYPVADEKVVEEVQKITAGSGNDTTALADSTKNLRVEIGDLVKVYRNGAGELEKISLIYDLDGEKLYSINPTLNNVDATSVERCFFGKIAKIDRNIIALEKSAGTYEYYNLKGKKLYVFDVSGRGGNCIQEGRMGDLSLGTNVAVVTKGGVPQYAFAY